jgi:hypothetical protein
MLEVYAETESEVFAMMDNLTDHNVEVRAPVEYPQDRLLSRNARSTTPGFY